MMTANGLPARSIKNSFPRYWALSSSSENLARASRTPSTLAFAMFHPSSGET
jgi:hypothetical protein